MTNKDDKVYKLEWTDISLDKFIEIIEVQEELKEKSLDEEVSIQYTAKMIVILFGIDNPESLPLDEWSKAVECIKFLGTPVPEVKHKKEFVLNNREYYFHDNPFKISAAQFFDWRQCIHQENSSIDYKECLSVFMIPKGHKYNDGYDFDVVKEDIGTISIVDAMALFSFFVNVLQTSLNVFKDYLTYQLKEVEKGSTLQQEEMNQLKMTLEVIGVLRPELVVQDMTSFHTT